MTLPPQPLATASAVLFDLDGVLVDSARVVERAWRRWAAEQGLDTDEVLAVIHGRRAAEIVQKFAPHLDPAEQVRRITGFELADDDLTLVPGALECAGIARRGPWAVVTSGGRELAAQRLAAVGFPAPEILVTGDDVEHGKPDPEPYLRAAALLGVPAETCTVVEDAPAGVLAGQRAGMTVLAVTTTHPADALAQADQVFPGMAAVAGYLRGQARWEAPRV